MATLKQRLHKKNSSGTYDTIHLETSASLVLMSNGTTVEAAINGKAASSHNHGAGNITSGTLAVARGGTGNTSVDTTPTSGSTKMCTSGGIYTALDTLKTSVSEGKSLIAAAVTGKGVTTAANATFATIASNIGSITKGYTRMNVMNWSTGAVPMLSTNHMGISRFTVDISSGSITLYIYNPSGSNNEVRISFE